LDVVSSRTEFDAGGGQPVIFTYPMNEPKVHNTDYMSRKTSVIYMTPTINDYGNFYELEQYTANCKFNHLIDFDYQLSSNEISYFQEHRHDILTQIFTEKRKNGKADVGKWNYKYMDTGSYIYNISRSAINLKFIKKYGTVSVYINDILSVEFETVDNFVKITDIVNYCKSWFGNKKITVNKVENIITKKSGFWC